MANSIVRFAVVLSVMFAVVNLSGPLSQSFYHLAYLDDVTPLDENQSTPSVDPVLTLEGSNAVGDDEISKKGSSDTPLEQQQQQSKQIKLDGVIGAIDASLEGHPNTIRHTNTQSYSDSLANYSHIIKPFNSKSPYAIARRKKQLQSAALLDHKFYSKVELENFIQSLTTTFMVWDKSTPYAWCHNRRRIKNDGLLYVKLPKCASSTASGVAMRVADKLGQRILGRKCAGHYLHSPASHPFREYGKRNESTSFLWSIIREPNDRTISYYFFEQVSRQKIEPSPEGLLSFLDDNSAMKKNYMIRYLKLQANNYNTHELIRDIMSKFNFIGVSERMDESLVVLSKIMQIPVADMVLLSSKVSGGYDAGRTKDGCVKLVKKTHFRVVDEYLQSVDWRKDNWDYILYQVVNRTLDNTINHFGRESVEQEVKQMRQLSEKVHSECLSEAVFPCPMTLPNHSEISRKSCYYGDSGCGYQCINRVLGALSDTQWNEIRNRQGDQSGVISLPSSVSFSNETHHGTSLPTSQQAGEVLENHVAISPIKNATNIPEFLLRYIQFHRDSIEEGVVKDGVPFLVYKCYGGCAGLGGRIKAMIRSFYAAICSGRVFLIDSPFPFPLQDFLMPNMIEWNSSYPNGTTEWDVFKREGSRNDVSIPNKTGVTIMKAHGKNVLDLSQIWKSSICERYWRESELQTLREDEHVQYHLGSRVLFEFTDQVKARANELRREAGISSNEPYVALHLRTGSGPTWNDRARRFLIRNRHNPVVFVNCFRLFRDTYGYQYGYIAADNELPKAELNQIEPWLKVANVDAFHIDRSLSRNDSSLLAYFDDPEGNNALGSASYEHAKNGTLNLFAEFKVLVDSKCTIMSWSSFSYAAHVMSSQPHCGLLVTDCSNTTVLQPNLKYNLKIGKWSLYENASLSLR